MLWFTAKMLGIPRYIWIIGAAVLLYVGYLILVAQENADDKHNQQVGATVERAQQQSETLDAVENANEAREKIAAPGPAGDRRRYDQCLRTARTSTLCARFLPVGETADGTTSAGR